MRTPRSAVGIVLFTLAGCGPQEPALAPLPAPPPASESATGAPPPAAEPARAAPSAELTPEQTAKLYQDCWAAFNAKDYTKLGACFADTATSEQVDSGAPVLAGKDIIEKGEKQFVNAFPDVTGEAQLTLVNNNNVVGVFLMRGNNKGPLMTPTGELPATNKKIGFLMGHSIEMKGGKAVRQLQYSDARTMLGQMGVIPGPVRKVMEQGGPEKPLVIATHSEAEKANSETLKKFYDAFNKHDSPALEALLADDFVFSDQAAPADLVGKKEAQRGYKELFKGMSDVRAESRNAWPAGDYVVSFTSLSGTNDGPIPSMKLWKKTGKRVSLSSLDIVKVQGGKLKNHWSFSNGMAFASQLGLLPPTKDASKAQASADKGAKSGAPGKTAPGASAPAAGTGASASAPAAAGKSQAQKPTGAPGAAAGKPETSKPAPGTPQKAGEAPKAAAQPKPAEPAKPVAPSAPAPKAAAPAPGAPAQPAPAAPK